MTDNPEILLCDLLELLYCAYHLREAQFFTACLEEGKILPSQWTRMYENEFEDYLHLISMGYRRYSDRLDSIPPTIPTSIMDVKKLIEKVEQLVSDWRDKHGWTICSAHKY